ncbi:MAG: hypothetical protein HY609_06335, partial [Deltaproteobacteria bacterium]|nr:hypothetical protein [Deltaproteobacteria bacterium]
EVALNQGRNCLPTPEEIEAVATCAAEIKEGVEDVWKAISHFSEESHCWDYFNECTFPSMILNPQECSEYALTCGQKIGDEAFNILKGAWDFVGNWLQKASQKSWENPIEAMATVDDARDALVIALFYFLIGDSLNTLSDDDADCFAKTLATTDIVLILLPFAEAEKIARGSQQALKVKSYYATPLKDNQWVVQISGKDLIYQTDAAQFWKSVKNLKTAGGKRGVLGTRFEDLAHMKILERASETPLKVNTRAVFKWLKKKPDLAKAVLHALGVDGPQQITESALQKIIMDKLNALAPGKQASGEVKVTIDSENEAGFLLEVPIKANDQLSFVANLELTDKELKLVSLKICAEKLAAAPPRRAALPYDLLELMAFLYDRGVRSENDLARACNCPSLIEADRVANTGLEERCKGFDIQPHKWLHSVQKRAQSLFERDCPNEKTLEEELAELEREAGAAASILNRSRDPFHYTPGPLDTIERANAHTKLAGFEEAEVEAIVAHAYCERDERLFRTAAQLAVGITDRHSRRFSLLAAADGICKYLSE